MSDQKFQNTILSRDILMLDIEDMDRNQIKRVPIEERKVQFVRCMVRKKYHSVKDFNNIFDKTLRMFRISMSKTELYNRYQTIGFKNPTIEHYCVSSSSRSHSGVCVISTIMAPEMTFHVDGKKTHRKFTCRYDCAFCPDDPTQARSYPRDEPVPLRGSHNEFDVVRQAHSRMTVLDTNHHVVDKIEWLVLGGTWSSFPKEYRAEYHCSMIFAANLWSESINVFNIHEALQKARNESGSTETLESDVWRQHVRPMRSVAEEIEINRRSTCRIIGITIETRPDEIKLSELRFMREHGVTRIQMGFQHTDNDVLKKNKRGCSVERCIRGLRMAMENGFKVDGHWMPDLPGSDPEKDRAMITRALTDPDLLCDQVKIYPCQVLDFTLIKEWYDAGDYKPYGEFDFPKLLALIVYAKSIMPPWVRTNRIVRDFPLKILKGGLRVTHMNDLVLRTLAKNGDHCMCIRCREVKRKEVNYDTAELMVRKYVGAGNGTEYFISMEIPKSKEYPVGVLLGFCRLRINPKDIDLTKQFPELHGCALIRELHVYGNTTSIGNEYTQHRGFGKRLLIKATEIARELEYTKIAVISGIGVQDYYKKRGFEDGFYMIKNL